jgi:hypothetical protein
VRPNMGDAEVVVCLSQGGRELGANPLLVPPEAQLRQPLLADHVRDPAQAARDHRRVDADLEGPCRTS